MSKKERRRVANEEQGDADQDSRQEPGGFRSGKLFPFSTRRILIGLHSSRCVGGSFLISRYEKTGSVYLK